MSSRSMGASQQVVKPPQRGIFPLDHFADCKQSMEHYLGCLKDHKDRHNECSEFSRGYLECRMENGLMSRENLDEMGYAEEKRVKGAKEYDYAKEKAGFTAGKHISRESEWWFLKRSNKDWEN
mmetsp:Transcript_9837/g.12986  ORF Transcript_9837/g.12986 Transcript_9837/m.12986 type:complete len:123 (-) Transcript_9837:235-603(-)|eukprot:CAMPEP_0198136612 /NCGR_PEP_ID=MMETSP1443-20131203/251_1 /TAXON_ID=186043 /ORGANISM="Entomoneis sp., Strain CCMP2396" /LENGTH=122 /DNA_ID=CAMNT_0043797863 /DNA_START=215 /DNA_END=583 /DNA_ORIENTATION=-